MRGEGKGEGKGEGRGGRTVFTSITQILNFIYEGGHIISQRVLLLRFQHHFTHKNQTGLPNDLLPEHRELTQ